jgi:hypothetical protein
VQGGWEPQPEIEGGPVWRRAGRDDICLWRISEGFLGADGLDSRWKAATQQQAKGETAPRVLLSPRVLG